MVQWLACLITIPDAQGSTPGYTLTFFSSIGSETEPTQTCEETWVITRYEMSPDPVKKTEIKVEE